TEMRSMALLQKALRGPEAIPAKQALRMATMNGAEALGLEKEIGSLETGKRADVAVVDLNSLHAIPSTNLVSALVYSAQAADVRSVVIDGQILMEDGELLTIDQRAVYAEAARESTQLIKRAGIGG
ncbi:MAG: amidohydrolase family protein, partial [Acidobacteriota bacterium]|nr:amidohydrolase family protein [Acidobacteriota bacterium]